jgi:hypothetical protein
MRNITSVDPPNLFTPDLFKESEPAVSAESSSGLLARNFVHWCWSVGDGFHNSPDLTNLQYWLQKHKHNPPQTEEKEILVEARRLFLKKVEQAVRKVDVAKVAD